MGCGSSRSADIVKDGGTTKEGGKAVKNNKVKSSSNGKKSSTKNNKNNKIKSDDKGGAQQEQEEDDHAKDSSLNSEASTIPATDHVYPNGNLGTPNSRPLGLGKLPSLKPPRTARVGFFDQNINDDLEINQNSRHVPVAFEVPAEDSEDGSGDLIKRHPPRRLRKMVEDKPEEVPSLTHESLEEKVQQANERRNQVLNLRAASARQKSARVRKPLFDAGYNPGEFGGGGEIETGERDETNGPEYL